MRDLKSESIVSLEQITSPTLFLDTNALHYMFSYLRYAKDLGLPPYKEKNWDEVKEALRNKLPRKIADYIMNGAKTLAFLQKQTQEQEAAIYTSRFAKSEILCGSLEGLAHARFAREGAIYRMRQRLGTLSELVSMYLEASDSEVVIKEWDKMLSLLKEQGRVPIELTENDTNFKQIADISEFLQSRVFIDVLDSWMYGCALAVGAEQIITFDSYFKKLINKLDNPSGDEDWKIVKEELLYRLQMVLDRVDVKTSDVNAEIEIPLPSVKDLPRDVPKLWS